ncbi:MAG TPA: hypothetical protein PKL14_04560 [Holophaga sp.]|nr:hypothetical protein [Holophaga sp.]
MKKIIQAISLLAAACSIYTNARQPIQSKDIESICNKDIKVYIQNPTLTHEHNKALFHIIREDLIKTDTWDVDENILEIIRDRENLKIDLNSGKIFYNRIHQNRPLGVNNLDFSTALSIAKSFIESKLGIPSADYTLDSHYSHQVFLDDGGLCTEDIYFGFRRVVNDLKCYGDGASFLIKIGKELTIDHISINWIEIEPDSDYVNSSTESLVAKCRSTANSDNNDTVAGFPPKEVYRTSLSRDGRLIFKHSIMVCGQKIVDDGIDQAHYSREFIPTIVYNDKNKNQRGPHD